MKTSLVELVKQTSSRLSSEFSKKLNYHFLSFKPEILKYVDLHYILTESLEPQGPEYEDLTHQQSFSEEQEKLHIFQSIESKNALEEHSEDFSDLPSLMPAGRILNTQKNYRKIMIQQFLLSNKNYYENKNNFEALLIIPEIEYPRELPPTSCWSSFKEKKEGFEKIKQISKFFFEPLPGELVNDSKVLKKYKFGDFPNRRFVFEPDFDYLQKPFTKMKKKEIALDKNEIMMKILGFVAKIEEKVMFGKKKVYKKVFLYAGEDLEGFIEELNGISGLDASWMITEDGDKLVQVLYTMKNCMSVEEMEKLNEKYGKEILDSNAEIEIDEEDQESLERLMSLNQPPAKTLAQYLHEKAEKKLN